MDALDPLQQASMPAASSESPQAAPSYFVVIKVGGNELDDPSFLDGLVLAVRAVKNEGHLPVIVHGGGKTIAHYQERLGLQARFIEGLRVTDEASMDVAEMVLSGLTNKRIVRALVHAGIRAAGFSGVDDGTIYVEPMWHPLGDLGRVGEIHDVDPHLIHTLLNAEIVPVISPISFGSLDALSYNVNADHAATAVAAQSGRNQAHLCQQRARHLGRRAHRARGHRRPSRGLDSRGHHHRRHDSQSAQRHPCRPRRRAAGGHHQHRWCPRGWWHRCNRHGARRLAACDKSNTDQLDKVSDQNSAVYISAVTRNKEPG